MGSTAADLDEQDAREYADELAAAAGRAWAAAHPDRARLGCVHVR